MAQLAQQLFVGVDGDAAPVAGIPLCRLFNSGCYVIAGIALLVMSRLAGFPGGRSMALAIVIGLGATAPASRHCVTDGA